MFRIFAWGDTFFIIVWKIDDFFAWTFDDTLCNFLHKFSRYKVKIKILNNRKERFDLKIAKYFKYGYIFLDPMQSFDPIYETHFMEEFID